MEIPIKVKTTINPEFLFDLKVLSAEIVDETFKFLI